MRRTGETALIQFGWNIISWTPHSHMNWLKLGFTVCLKAVTVCASHVDSENPRFSGGNTAAIRTRFIVKKVQTVNLLPVTATMCLSAANNKTALNSLSRLARNRTPEQQRFHSPRNTPSTNQNPRDGLPLLIWVYRRQSFCAKLGSSMQVSAQ